MEQPQLNIDLKNTTGIQNSEGGSVFQQGLILRTRFSFTFSAQRLTPRLRLCTSACTRLIPAKVTQGRKSLAVLTLGRRLRLQSRPTKRPIRRLLSSQLQVHRGAQ